MHAIRRHSFGPAENLIYEEVPDPEPADGQVRVSVEAAGVDLIDTSIRRGEGGGPYPFPDLPVTPGREVAGRVDRVGPDVDESWLGRRMVAYLGRGQRRLGGAGLRPRRLDGRASRRPGAPRPPWP